MKKSIYISDAIVDELFELVEQGKLWLKLSNRVSKVNPRDGLEFMQDCVPTGRFVYLQRNMYFVRPVRKDDIDYLRKILSRGRVEGKTFLSWFEVWNGDGKMQKYIRPRQKSDVRH